jgi:hypothetical protein
LPIPTATDAVNPSGSITAVGLDFRSTRVRQVNVIVDKELFGSVVSAGYIGSRGDRVAVANVPVNLAPVGPGTVQPRRPYNAALPGISAITIFKSDYESSYDALQLVFQRRYRDGLTFNTNYTLAHNVNTGPAPWQANLVERFDAPNDVRHRWVLTANYELPFARSRNGVTGAAFGGWQINAIAQWQTGIPFDITNAAARANTGGNDRPNLVGDPSLDQPTIGRWFNTAAFEAQPINTIGDRVVPRNYLHGPPQRRLDLSLFKDVPLHDTWRLQLRVEGYNVLNTTNFANPNSALGNSNFGTITGTRGTPRQMQFAAKLLF